MPSLALSLFSHCFFAFACVHAYVCVCGCWWRRHYSRLVIVTLRFLRDCKLCFQTQMSGSHFRKLASLMVSGDGRKHTHILPGMLSGPAGARGIWNNSHTPSALTRHTHTHPTENHRQEVL